MLDLIEYKWYNAPIEGDGGGGVVILFVLPSRCVGYLVA
jgi:hypothetical protein